MNKERARKLQTVELERVVELRVLHYLIQVYSAIWERKGRRRRGTYAELALRGEAGGVLTISRKEERDLRHSLLLLLNAIHVHLSERCVGGWEVAGVAKSLSSSKVGEF